MLQASLLTEDADITEPCEDDECTLRVFNYDKECGYPVASGPLSWLNSARITIDPCEDAVHCVVSVGDPRGGFCFTVRRMPDSRLVIYTPYPGEDLPHEQTQKLDEGILVVGYLTDCKDPRTFVAGDYSDEPEEIDE